MSATGRKRSFGQALFEGPVLAAAPMSGHGAEMPPALPTEDMEMASRSNSIHLLKDTR